MTLKEFMAQWVEACHGEVVNFNVLYPSDVKDCGTTLCYDPPELLVYKIYFDYGENSGSSS